MNETHNFNDPRRLAGERMPAYWPGFPETWWRVEGWNDMPKGGCCTYEQQPSKEAAMTQARHFREHGDGRPTLDGEPSRRYDHYDVLEMTFDLSVVTTVHDVPAEVEAQ